MIARRMITITITICYIRINVDKNLEHQSVASSGYPNFQENLFVLDFTILKTGEIEFKKKYSRRKSYTISKTYALMHTIYTFIFHINIFVKPLLVVFLAKQKLSL
jgi:hypothetical protein